MNVLSINILNRNLLFYDYNKPFCASLVQLIRTISQHMNFKKSIISSLFAFSLLFLVSCNQEKKQEDVGEDLTPVEGNDPTRYNINAPDEDLINMDSTNMDSINIDSAQ